MSVMELAPRSSSYELDGAPELGRQDIIDQMLRTAPYGQHELSSEIHRKLGELTDRLVTVAGTEATAEYERYLAVSNRELSLDKDRLHKQLNDKTILVTGGAGLIGTALMQELQAFSPAQLVSIDFAEPQQKIEDVHYYDMDIRDTGNLKELVKAVKPDIIYHLAADKYNHLAESRVHHTMSTNILGTTNVVEAAQEAKVSQLVYASTGKATRPYSPDVYASSKKTGEWLVSMAAEKSDLLCSGVRFTHVVDGANVIAQINKSIATDQPVRLHDPDIWFYVQSSKESAQLLLQAGLEAEPSVLNMCAINNLELPINLTDLGVGAIAKTGADTPIYFCGIEAGYEEKAWPGLYDVQDAGDISPLINALEAPQVKPSEVVTGIDVFPLQFDTDETVIEQFADLYKVLSNDTEARVPLKQLGQEFSWGLLDATLRRLPEKALERAARRVTSRADTRQEQAINPDHLRVDLAIEHQLGERKDHSS